jgi:hypothetical protein
VGTAGATLLNRADGLRVRLPRAGSAVELPPFTVAADGVYLFRLKYQLRKPAPASPRARVIFSGVRAGHTLRLSARTWESTPEEGFSVRMLALGLKAGRSYQLRVTGKPPRGERGCAFVLKRVDAYREQGPAVYQANGRSPGGEGPRARETKGRARRQP